MDVRTAEQWVCQNVRQWILDGTLAASEEITQQELASRLGVSRSPVRDALRRLEALGLVTINPNQRAVVTSFTLDGMREVFEIRAALEALAAFHAVPNLTPSDLIELESLADVMARLPDVAAYLGKHELFHDRVAQRAEMPRLRQELSRLREMVMPYIGLYGAGRDSAELVGESHAALVQILAHGSRQAASDAFMAHARAAYEQLASEMLRTRAEDFELTEPDVTEPAAAEVRDREADPPAAPHRHRLRRRADEGAPSIGRKTIERLKGRRPDVGRTPGHSDDRR